TYKSYGTYRTYRQIHPSPLTTHHLSRIRLRDPIGRVHKDHRRLILLGLAAGHDRVGGHDHEVAGLYEVRAGPVHADHARPGRAGQRVGHQPGPVAHVPDVDLLIRQNVGRVQQVGVDSEAALVVHIGPGHGRPVDL